MLRRCLPMLGLLLLSAPVAATENGSWIADQIEVAHYRDVLDNLLFTHLGDDRGVGGPEHDLARDNIATTFAGFGLDVTIETFVYAGRDGYNVVATQLGTMHPTAQYIVGAHYDSVGNAGADDDASGVAALLEIARVLSRYDTEYTIKYIAFDMEELGLIGSQRYVAGHSADDIRGMIQLDMIAYNDGGNDCVIHGRRTSALLKRALRGAIREYSDLGVSIERHLDRSDHAPFEWAGFDACLLIEAARFHPHYHQAADSVDTPNYIDYAYAADMVRSVAGFLADHAVVILCVGDLDHNRVVNLTDVATVLAHFGEVGPGSPGDTDADGDTDANDLVIVLERFGATCD